MQDDHVRRMPKRRPLGMLLGAACALGLQGCGNRRACKISDIYGMIQVDGRTGLSKGELEKAGVKLCARHMRREETYRDGACNPPEMVFNNDELPTSAQGDVNALLLISCPSTSYPKGKELQRVTCNDDYIGEAADGTVQKELHLRFDNYDQSSNCMLSGNRTLEDASENETDITDEIGPLDGAARHNADLPAEQAINDTFSASDYLDNRSGATKKDVMKKSHILRESGQVSLVRAEAADESKVAGGHVAGASRLSIPARRSTSTAGVSIQPHGLVSWPPESAKHGPQAAEVSPPKDLLEITTSH
mmetsp:Transcript_79222/g.144524  ORF Transcript_79222/g.144524 Transcript_79222/m.144524 type:complete len:305 (-) Transcript_79222:107-1021(-)